MRLLLDENIPYRLKDELSRLGHVVTHVYDEKLGGAADEDVLRRACDHDAVLVTLDRDLADIRRFDPAATPGIVRLRLRTPTFARVRDVVVSLLARVPESSFRGRLIVATESRYRIR